MTKKNITGAKPNFFDRFKDIIYEVEDVLKTGIMTQGFYLKRLKIVLVMQLVQNIVSELILVEQH